ncbi:trigger factor [Chloroflexus sp.]|uniref:trigger factor n=1 Tax=Chloroflexus sp. TaxID=1904827 RepID=UPI00298F004E|nr:trigger factor [Chloroflexus sp.]MCS6886813.1 trigger factor [Chloroflexus sp.]MDW8404434.1 trigger factor [Chloroflexus sp.]
MKVTTEKLPKSLLSLQIEIDRDQFERGLDQAARRLSQKFPIHGFRPGKAPRFIIERTFGRAALIEEATEDLINTAYKKAIQQEKIEVIGPPTLERIDSLEPFIFTVNVPVPPTVTLADYRNIRVPLTVEPITDEMVELELERMREEHVTLQELDEPRPAQQGDRVRVLLSTKVEGDEENGEAEAETEAEPEAAGSEEQLDLEPNRLVDELYQGLIGMNVGDKKEIVAVMPDDHAEESIRGKKVTFKVEVLGIQRRIVPAWEELPALANVEGTLDDLKAKVRANLEEAERRRAEQALLNAYLEQLVEQTTFDIPDVMIRDLAHSMLHDQEQQYARYGITLEQVLQYRGITHDQAVDELLPEAERQTKVTLALSEVIKREGLTVSDDEIAAEIERILADYEEERRPQLKEMLNTQLRSSVANVVLDKKLRARLAEIARGELSATPAAEPATQSTATDEQSSRATDES